MICKRRREAPNEAPNLSKMGPKWFQNGSPEASGRPWGAPRRLPGGPGAPRLILSDFWLDLGHRFWLEKSLESFKKEVMFLNGIVGPREAFWDSFGVDFVVIVG